MSAKAVLGSAVVVAALTVCPVAHADTLYLGGTATSPYSDGPTDLSWAGGPKVARQVGYPAALIDMGSSIRTGTDNLDAAIKASTGPTTVYGVSQGDVVINAEKQRLMNDPHRPAADQLSFVQLADPTSPTGIMGRNPGAYVPVLNLTFTAAVPTPYTTTVISRQYDGIADWPSVQTNWLADLNAVAGAAYLHPDYGGLDLSTAQVTKYGTTTVYRVPTANLPLLQPLRDAGVPKPIVDVAQTVLKPIVDAGYRSPRSTVRASSVRVRHHRNEPWLLGQR